MAKSFIQVFEYQSIGWDRTPGFTQAHFETLARYHETHPNPYYTLIHRGVKFTQYVGVLQVGSLTIEVLPKADREPVTEGSKAKWQRILLEMLKECHLLKVEAASTAALRLKANSILDFYIGLFLKETESIVRQGLVKKYRQSHGNVNALKGRLDFGRHISRNLVHQEHFYTHHQVYDKEHLINQLIYKTLALLPLLTTNPLLTDKVSRLQLAFPELPDVAVTAATFGNLKLDRKSLHYRAALQIAELLLLNFRPDIQRGANHVLAILFDMNKLFEEYVLRRLQKATVNTGWSVSGQARTTFWQHKTLRPDIVVRLGTSSVVLDTKWKVLKAAQPSDEDLKQMFSYNHYFDATHSILLYPFAEPLPMSKGAFVNNQIRGGAAHSCEIRFLQLVNQDGSLNRNAGAELLQYLDQLAAHQ